MTAREIRGILAHEIVHVRNRDIAFMQLAMVVGQLTRTVSQIAILLVVFSLFLQTGSAPAFPILPLLVLAFAPLGVGLLQLALSRTREGEADLEAAELTGDPHGLASALLKLRRREQMLLRGRFPAAARLRVASLFRDHPAHSSPVGHAAARRKGSGRSSNGPPLPVPGLAAMGLAQTIPAGRKNSITDTPLRDIQRAKDCRWRVLHHMVDFDALARHATRNYAHVDTQKDGPAFRVIDLHQWCVVFRD
jgi:heat shock protein HtpX